MRKEVLRMEHVTYKEKDRVLLRDFDLNIFEGEVMGLLTIDAYGLSALLKILRDYPPIYHGYIYYREKLVDSWVEEKHSRNRIAFITDNSSLVEGQSILTNVMILRRGYRQELIHKKLLLRQFQLFLDELEIRLDPMLPVEKLTPFERIVVEILRAVVADCHLIVMQEVHTIISDSEINSLYGIIHKYTRKGFSFLYISPHFEEHKQICDRTAVMMNRRVSKILSGEQMSGDLINRYCSGEYIQRVQERLNQRKDCCKKIVFSVQNLTGQHVNRLSFRVRKGECLAIQCLDEKVLKELLQILEGREKPDSGEYFLEGMPVSPSDRHRIAVILDQPWESMVYDGMTVYDNLCIGMDYRMPQVWSSGSIAKSIRNTIEEEFGDDCAGKQVSELTDQQKSRLVYTRILLQKPKIVFCIQPFKGEDLSHRLLTWDMQKRLLDREIAVVIIAVNMADALSIADRVIRIDQNTRVEEYERRNFNKLPPTIPWYSLYQSME